MGARICGVAGLLCLLLAGSGFANPAINPAIVDEVRDPRRVYLTDAYNATPNYFWAVQVYEDARADEVEVGVVMVNIKDTMQALWVEMQSGKFTEAVRVSHNSNVRPPLVEEADLTEGYYVRRPFGDSAPTREGNEEQKEYLQRISIEFTDRPEEVLGHFFRITDELVAMIDASTLLPPEMAWVLNAPSEPERDSMGFLFRYSIFRETPTGLLNGESKAAVTWGALKQGREP